LALQSAYHDTVFNKQKNGLLPLIAQETFYMKMSRSIFTIWEIKASFIL